MAEKIDQEVYDMFLQESLELFEALNKGLLSLEKKPNNEKTLYSIMRIIHSLKGSAGMLHFERFQEICHRLEDFMELIHQQPDAVTRDVMDFLFSGSDIIQRLFMRSMESLENAESFLPAERLFLENLEQKSDVILRGAFNLENSVLSLVEQLESLAGSVGDIVDTSNIRKNAEAIRSYLMVDKTSGKRDIKLILADNDVTAELRYIQDKIGDAERNTLEPETAKQFFEHLEIILLTAERLDDTDLNAAIAEARENIELFHDLELDFDSLQAELYSQLIDDLVQFSERNGNEPKEGEKPDHEKPTPAERVDEDVDLSMVRARTTVRIEETKIDAFLGNVGEMIILGEIFNNLEKRISPIVGAGSDLSKEFKTANKSFANHIFSLQNALMDVRRVEIGNITGSLARLGRDTAAKLNKNVRIEINGEDAVLDKSHMDDVKTSLVHIIRNAIDHGIEDPDSRSALGKNAQGVIRLDAYNDMEFLIIKITDDGRGIDPKEVRQLAVEKKIVTSEEAEKLSDQEVLRLTFTDGFSTSETVSDVSGRGVGMSVVIENLNKMGGGVEISSEIGLSTEITLRVPLSIMLSVTDAFVLRIGHESYALPIQYVVESFQLDPDRIVDMQGRGECVSIRGKTFRLLRLDTYFGVVSEGSDNGKICIMISANDETFCILVDDIVDHQQIVIKEIEGFDFIHGVLGGALLGDGTVGMVIDAEELSLNKRSNFKTKTREIASCGNASKEVANSNQILEENGRREEKEEESDQREERDVTEKIQSTKEETAVETVTPIDIEPLLVELRQECDQRLGKLKRTFLLHEIEGFAENMTNLGIKHQVAELREYGETLAKQTKVLDLDNIPKTLDRFTELVEKLGDLSSQ